MEMHSGIYVSPEARMKYKQALSTALFVGLSSIAAAEPVLEIEKIAGKNPIEVANALGKPSSHEKTKHGPKMSYKEGKIEVVFIGGKADWITVSNLSGILFNANAIEAIGLKPSAPTFKSNVVMRWEPCGSYNSVSVFNANGRVDYAFVKAVTK